MAPSPIRTFIGLRLAISALAASGFLVFSFGARAQSVLE